MYELNSVIKGDSDKILPELIEQGFKFDLVLTDPPYNINKDFGNDSDRLAQELYLSLTESRIENCKLLLKDEGSVIWFGIHDYIGFIQVLMHNAKLNYRRLNIWHYKNGFSRKKKEPLTEYEPFLWFSKSNKRWTYNVDDVRVPYRSTERLKNPVYYKNSKGERKVWKPNPKGAMRGDIWEYPTLSGKAFANERTEHPTQKPEALITDIIKAFCPKNEEGKYEGIILDPFLGSGTLAVCCEKLNKEGHNISWLGIEMEDKWCAISEMRIDKIRSEITLL